MTDAKDRTYIAQLTLIALTPNGQRDTVFVAVGAPVQGEANEWQCPVRVQGSGQQWGGAISAADSFQALCLAMSLVSRSLRNILDAGNRLLMPFEPGDDDDPDDNDVDWPFEAYFGVLEKGQTPLARQNPP